MDLTATATIRGHTFHAGLPSAVQSAMASPAPLRVAANHDDVRFCRFFPGSGFRVPPCLSPSVPQGGRSPILPLRSLRFTQTLANGMPKTREKSY